MSDMKNLNSGKFNNERLTVTMTNTPSVRDMLRLGMYLESGEMTSRAKTDIAKAKKFLINRKGDINHFMGEMVITSLLIDEMLAINENVSQAVLVNDGKGFSFHLTNNATMHMVFRAMIAKALDAIVAKSDELIMEAYALDDDKAKGLVVSDAEIVRNIDKLQEQIDYLNAIEHILTTMHTIKLWDYAKVMKHHDVLDESNLKNTRGRDTRAMDALKKLITYTPKAIEQDESDKFAPLLRAIDRNTLADLSSQAKEQTQKMNNTNPA